MSYDRDGDAGGERQSIHPHIFGCRAELGRTYTEGEEVDTDG